MKIPSGVRAVFFDAVGTLIYPDPPPWEVYANVGRSLGSRWNPEEVRERFWDAYYEQERRDAEHGDATSEERETERWRAIVGAVLDDVSDSALCFLTLYAHFGGPGAWACTPGAAEAIAGLRGRGLFVGMASNFDGRLRGVVAGLPELAGLQALVISSEVGWKKPAPQFYQAVCRAAGLPPEQVLMVGDNLTHDVWEARRAGLHALLFREGTGEWRIADIRDLLT